MTLYIVLCHQLDVRCCTLGLTDKREYEIENMKLVSDDLKTASTKRIRSKIVQNNNGLSSNHVKKVKQSREIPTQKSSIFRVFLERFFFGKALAEAKNIENNC